MAELPNRHQLQAAFAAKVARLTSSQRHKLEKHLGFPPDIARVPETFWVESQKELNEQLAAVLLLLFIASAEHHGWDAADRMGLDFATQHAQQVSVLFTGTTRDRLAGAARGWRPDLPRHDFQRDLVSILGPERAEALAVNETTVAQTRGGEAAIIATVGISDEDEWKTNPHLSQTGPCPICKPLDGTPRTVWALKFPDGPPAPHIGCVCEILYKELQFG